MKLEDKTKLIFLARTFNKSIYVPPNLISWPKNMTKCEVDDRNFILALESIQPRILLLTVYYYYYYYYHYYYLLTYLLQLCFHSVTVVLSLMVS